MPVFEDSRNYWLRRANSAADRVPLDTEERHDLAEFALKRDVNTWRELSIPDLRRMVDMIEGWEMVETLRAQRPSPQASRLSPSESTDSGMAS